MERHLQNLGCSMKKHTLALALGCLASINAHALTVTMKGTLDTGTDTKNYFQTGKTSLYGQSFTLSLSADQKQLQHISEQYIWSDKAGSSVGIPFVFSAAMTVNGITDYFTISAQEFYISVYGYQSYSFQMYGTDNNGKFAKVDFGFPFNAAQSSGFYPYGSPTAFITAALGGIFDYKTPYGGHISFSDTSNGINSLGTYFSKSVTEIIQTQDALIPPSSGTVTSPAISPPWVWTTW
jgi:hypothetical protein